jgi:hypothetical protein
MQGSYSSLFDILAGFKIQSMSNEIVEVRVKYDDWNDPNAICAIGRTANANRNCTLVFDIPQDMEPPILVHYELSNFYQNHRNYVKSLDSFQVRMERVFWCIMVSSRSRSYTLTSTHSCWAPWIKQNSRLTCAIHSTSWATLRSIRAVSLPIPCLMMFSSSHRDFLPTMRR